jgi:SAM-dependent methyltransferase
VDPLSDDPYRDPDLYDLEYADMHEDVAYYVAMAWQSSGSVLELGCGTGRLTLPMLQTGARVVGVDRAEGMLEGLRRKLAHETPELRARCELVQGDFVTFDLGRRFATVIWPFNALHHCRDDAELARALDRIVAHLAPDGVLGLDAYLPDYELYDRDPEERFEERTFIDPRTHQRLDSWEQGWWDAAARVHHVVYHYRHADGRVEKVHLPFRMWEIEELRGAFRRAGLAIVHEASDFRDGGVGHDDLKYVATLQHA